MKTSEKVTRIAYSDDLNRTKYDALNEIANRCGNLRTEIWRNYGSKGGLGANFHSVCQDWRTKKKVDNLPEPIWTATLNETLEGIKANREAAKEEVVRHIFRNIDDIERRQELLEKLTDDSVWLNESYLRRLMRKHWKPAPNQTYNKIILEPTSYKFFQHNGRYYIKVISLVKDKQIAIPISTNHPITGRILLILRGGSVRIYYTIDNTDERAGDLSEIGIDKGYSEAVVDSEGKSSVNSN